MEDILKNYESVVTKFKDFKDKIEILLIDLLKAKSINFHQITSRIKTKESLSKKINRKQGISSLEDITDIVGCRIVTYFEDEVDKVANVIEKEFEVDIDNSIDKRKIEYDRFGYLSLHYVVKLNSNRLKLTEYKTFKDIKFEIQIRSILQHSWAEIEHDIGYKGKFSIPNIVKRRFSRIAALLETADLEFVRLKDELSFYEKNIRKEIADNPSKVNLDKASLLSFISTNKIFKRADSVIAKYLNIDLSEDYNFIEEQISLLQFAGIQSVYDLEQLYNKNLECIIEYSKNWRGISNVDNKNRGSGIIGISIYDAAYYLIAKSRSKEELILYLSKRFKGKNIDHDKAVSNCFEALRKISKNCR
jgi:putative GTP pyrophosphokinase